MEDKRLSVLSLMKDHYEHLFSRVHYLFVAHGAGFVGGLTFLKDYTSMPQYRGVGIPIALFGIGLICAIFSYVTLSIAQMVAKNSVLDKVEHKPSTIVFWVHYSGLFVSLLALMGALLIIVWRVAIL